MEDLTMLMLVCLFPVCKERSYDQVDVNQSRDPDGLRCFYYLVQVLKHSHLQSIICFYYLSVIYILFSSRNANLPRLLKQFT